MLWLLMTKTYNMIDFLMPSQVSQMKSTQPPLSTQSAPFILPWSALVSRQSHKTRGQSGIPWQPSITKEAYIFPIQLASCCWRLLGENGCKEDAAPPALVQHPPYYTILIMIAASRLPQSPVVSVAEAKLSVCPFPLWDGLQSSL